MKLCQQQSNCPQPRLIFNNWLWATILIGVSTLSIGFFVLSCQDGPVKDPNVDLINQAITAAGARWIADETWVSRLDEQERQAMFGTNENMDLEQDNVLEAVPVPPPALLNQADLPERFDWQNYQGQNYMSGVRNQAGCGSCVVFAIIGAMESSIRVSNQDPDAPINFAEQHIVSCVEGSCNSGWSFTQVLNYLVSDGIPSEDCFNYQATELPCSQTCSGWRDQVVKLDAYYQVGNGLNEIKQEIMRTPLTTSFLVYEDFMYYDGGVYENVFGDLLAGHAVVIVGWDENPADAPGKGCFICRNSWGPNWGEQGYFRIAYFDCGLGLQNNFSCIYEGDLTPPPPPTGLKASNYYSQGIAGASLRRIDLSWNEKPANEVYGFHVYRATVNDPSHLGRITESGYPVKTNHFEYYPPLGDTDQIMYFAVTSILASGRESAFSEIVPNMDPA